MQTKSIQVGNVYNITLGRNEVLGEVIEATESGWNVRLLASDKVVKVNNPDRFIRKARTIAITGDAPKANGKKAKATTSKQSKEGMSALDATYRVLVEIGTALTVRQITEVIQEKGYCPNLNGATPHLTISSALQREVARKGDESRFYKGGKGLFGAYSE
ncbi:MAG: winged helix-turn-helix domain-containing protein [Planctomycetaceae bacterium]|nr:winged helix-turn-helix domain-containing protein [Planctomycetaceae bacterium]